MALRFGKAILSISAIALVASCASPPAGMGPLPQGGATQGAVAPRAANASIEIRTVVPFLKNGSRPRYTSVATKSLLLELQGPTKVTAAVNVAPGATGCTNTSTSRICIDTFPISSGSYTATIKTYDLAPVANKIPTKANLLSQILNAAITIAPGLNVKSLTLEGVPKNLELGGVPGNITAGTAASAALSIVAQDADGYIIVGPYDEPLKLSTSDKTGATTVTTSGADKPPAGEITNSGDRVVFHYTGLAIVEPTISVSATGVQTVGQKVGVTLQTLGPSTLTKGVPINAGSSYTAFVERHAARKPQQSQLLSFTAAEPGWTTSPYNKPLKTVLSSQCTFVTVAQPTPGKFEATLANAPTPAAGCTLTISDGAGQSIVIPLGFVVYTYSGNTTAWAVPAGIGSVTVQAVGASGGTGCQCGVSAIGSPGLGGVVISTVDVYSGEYLVAQPGGKGGDGANDSTGAAGYFEGGAAGSTTSLGHYNSAGGGGGGGGSAVFSNYNGELGGSWVDVAAGGGGSGGSCSIGGAGGSGGATGGDGQMCTGGAGGGGAGGAGATSSTGGTGGAGSGTGSMGSTGGVAQGGAGGAVGATSLTSASGGGGGGGIWGGGGGGALVGGTTAGAGGGGGGSNYVTGVPLLSATAASPGNGIILFTW